MNKSRLIVALAGAMLCTATVNTPVLAAEPGTSVTIATNKDLKDLQPWGGANDMLLNYQVYDSLVGIDADGNYVPKLAESWEMAEDGMSFTFHLRKDATFQNGNPVTADDVAWSINSAIEGKKVSTYTYGMDHVEVVDDNTAKLVMSEPYPEVIGELALTFFGIMDKSAVENLDPTAWTLEDVTGAGSGPYILTDVESGSHMTLKAYDGYWGGSPEIETVTMQIITDESTAAVSLETGDIDFVYNLTQFNYDKMVNLDNVKTGEQECKQLVYMPVNVSENNADSPVQDKKVRQAINYALDRESLNIIFSDGNGTVTSNCNLPGEIGYNEDTQVRQDLDKAKELMAESSYPDGCDLTMLICTAFNPNFKSTTEVIQSELAEIGINLEVVDQPMASFFESLGTMAYGDFTLLTMECQWPDVFYFYGALERSRNYSPLNYSGNEDADLDDMIANLRTLSDDEEKQKGSEELMSIFYDECTVYPLMYASPRKIAWNASLDGVELNPQGFYSVANWTFNE